MCKYKDVHHSVIVKVAQSCLTLCNPIDYTVHWILNARILEWVNPVSPSLRSFFLPCWATCSVFPEQTDPSCCHNRTTHVTWGLTEVPSPAHSSPERVHSEVSVCWGLMEVPSPAHSSPERVHSEVSVCWGPHTHTAPQTVPTQAPCKFWREDHLSQIWSFTQRCVHCDVHLWLRRSSLPFTFPSRCLFPMPSSDILGLGELSLLPSLKQNHKSEWIYIAKSVSFEENFLEWKKKLSNGIPETSIR